MDNRRVTLCLVHDGTQPGTPVAEPVHFGLQDTKGEVHPGELVNGAEQQRRFEAVLSVKGEGGSRPPVFAAPFCHGPPASRFLYLSWKRQGVHAAPWAWRIKVPLSGVDWPLVEAANEPGLCIEANVTGRRPHATEPISWRVATCGGSTTARKPTEGV